MSGARAVAKAPADTPRSAEPPAIRPAVAADLPAIERLLRAANLPLVGVADSLDTFFVVELAGEDHALAGVGGLELGRINALVRSVVVGADWRGHGLGRALVQRLIAAAEQRQVRTLYLLTTTAEHYFPEFGFSVVSRDDVPADIRESEEFRTACPASAIVMARSVGSGGE